MDALTLLQQHIDVEKILKHYQFEKVKPDGKFTRSCCKLHGGNNPSSFVINNENGLWYCHTQCGGGDIYTMVQRLEEIEFPQAVEWVAKFFHIDITNLEITQRKERHLEELKNWIKAMRSRKKKSLSEFLIQEEIREVTKFRQFKEETLRYFGLGYVESVRLAKRELNEKGEKQFYVLGHRLVFPIIFKAMQVGISFRKTKPNDVPKWSQQPVGLDYGDILYNYDNAVGQPKVTIVEGIPDVWAYHEIGVIAVATFGAHLTEEQYKLLIRTGADIVLSYDGDDAGRIATEKALKMFRHKANVEVVEFSEGQDPEKISRDELANLYQNKLRRM